MSDKVGLVTCMYVNNVMGQIQPIQDIADILKRLSTCAFSCGWRATLGKIPMNFNGIDSLSLSGHKFNGLKGQGLLLIKIYKILNQSFMVADKYGLRSGTVNFGFLWLRAIKQAVQGTEETNRKLKLFNQAIVTFLKDFKGVYINSPENGAPHIINIGFPGVKGEVLVHFQNMV